MSNAYNSHQICDNKCQNLLLPLLKAYAIFRSKRVSKRTNRLLYNDGGFRFFCKKWLPQVSVHDIREMAEVSIGSLYKYFGNKEGVAKALYYHLFNEMELMVARITSLPGTPKSQIYEIIRQLFMYTETRPNIIAFMLYAKHQEFLPNEPPIWDSTTLSAMRNIVSDAMKSGELRAGDSIVTSALIYGPVIRLIQLRLDGVIQHLLNQVTHGVLDHIWYGSAKTPPYPPMKKMISSKNQYR